MTTFNYTVISYDLNNRTVDVDFGNDQWARVPLIPMPSAANFKADLDKIVKAYAPSAEELAAIAAPVDQDVASLFDQSVGAAQQAEALPTRGYIEPEPIAEVTKTLDELKAEFVAEVDDHIASIYGRFQRFQVEYEKREAAAQAYAADNTVAQDASIVEFASGIPDTSYADAVAIVLQQANALRGAVDDLGVLRMKKHRIKNALDATTAQQERDAIIADADQIAAAL